MTIWCLYSNVSSTLILLSDLDNAREAIKTRFSISDPRWYAWIMTSRNRPSKPLVSEKAKPRNVGSKTLHRLSITLTASASGQRGTSCWYFVIRKVWRVHTTLPESTSSPFSLQSQTEHISAACVWGTDSHGKAQARGRAPRSQPASQPATHGDTSNHCSHQRSGCSPAVWVLTNTCFSKWIGEGSQPPSYAPRLNARANTFPSTSRARLGWIS